MKTPPHEPDPNPQLELDLAGSHADATTAFKEWLLSQPLPEWATTKGHEDD